MPRGSRSYLLAVYSRLEAARGEPAGRAFAPPPAPDADYTSLYRGSSTVRMGWGEGGAGAGGELVPPFPGMGGDYAANPLGNPFAPMGGGCFPAATFGRGYGPLGPPGRGRGRGGRRPPRSQEVGEVLLPEEGRGGNTAYTGRLGRKGQVGSKV